jgi:hypothetical protein
VLFQISSRNQWNETARAARNLFRRDLLILLRIRHGTGIGVIGINIIERAYQLAAESGSVEEVKRKLMREGYLNVHSHLSGHQIRHDLLKRLNPERVTYRKARSGEIATQRATVR